MDTGKVNDSRSSDREMPSLNLPSRAQDDEAQARCSLFVYYCGSGHGVDQTHVEVKATHKGLPIIIAGILAGSM
jgi:hypothetical protein